MTSWAVIFVRNWLYNWSRQAQILDDAAASLSTLETFEEQNNDQLYQRNFVIEGCDEKSCFYDGEDVLMHRQYLTIPRLQQTVIARCY